MPEDSFDRTLLVIGGAHSAALRGRGRRSASSGIVRSSPGRHCGDAVELAERKQCRRLSDSFSVLCFSSWHQRQQRSSPEPPRLLRRGDLPTLPRSQHGGCKSLGTYTPERVIPPLRRRENRAPSFLLLRLIAKAGSVRAMSAAVRAFRCLIVQRSNCCAKCNPFQRHHRTGAKSS